MADAIRRDASGCPELETIAAFIDGRLTGAERTRVVEHLADCSDCYFVFSEAARIPADAATDGARTAGEGARGVSRAFMRPRVMWPAVAALAAAAAVVVAIRVAPWRSSTSSQLEALVAAVGTERTFEPRLTGGFAYGPVRGALRGAGTASAGSPDVRIAAAEIEKVAEARRTPETLRTLGISFLVTGEVGRAVSVLEEAADRSGVDARTLSDLSAAYLVRAARNNQAEDVAKALTVADRAVKAEPRLAEAWFNRACALERLGLAAEASAAWRDYLRVDSQSGWADEAKRRAGLGGEVR